MRVGFPHPGLARRDRRALRGGLLVALAAAFAIAGPDAPGRIGRALRPDVSLAVPAPSTEIQAWITPPAYTRLAPIFLRGEGGTVSAPAGSHLTVNVSGGTGEPTLILAGRAEAFRELDPSSFQADRDLELGGRLEVRRHGRELAAWELTVVADRPPSVAWTELPGRSPRSLQTRLPWEATDDYGVVSLQAELRLEARPDAPALVLTIPVPGGVPKAAKGASLQDLTAHPWAGLDVSGRLIARDGAGQTGASDTATFALPERSFQHPVARALIEVRKGLSLAPQDRDAAVAVLDVLLMRPQAMAGDGGVYVNLAAIYYLLVRERGDPAIAEAQRRLWELALHLEEGSAERTARALEEARQAAQEALERAEQQPNDANRAELDQRLKELEEAIQRHMEALVDQARREMSEIPFDPEAQRLDSRDMERMAEEAREAARQGRMDEARERMAQLEQMLDRLRNARPAQGRNDRQNAAKRQRGRDQMSAVQDMIGRQGGLLDHAQQRAPSADNNEGRMAPGFRPPGRVNPQRPQLGNGDADAQREADRRVQQALRRALGELMQQFGDLTGQVPPSLGEADTAMREAVQALGQRQDAEAGAAGQRAIEALQKGGREMGQQLAKQFGRGQMGEGDEGEEGDPTGIMGFSLQDGQGNQNGSPEGTLPGQRGRKERRDPLGRQLGQGSSGADEASDVRVPEEMERQRSRAIQEELRRRGAERTRPQQELDYIERLLKQF